ncbi:amidohydrolase family protein [Arcticibacter sp.]|jgi:L-fuconolactonase|uniref:amidohydrolase family protein n=1 Tax=Arcticibacter sp. TaxID=1872630 RepID=UPI003890A3A0
MKIDSHQHFWNYDPVRDSWINDEMAVIRNDFAPADVQPMLRESGFDGCIAVQADQNETETAYLLRLSDENDFIKGVVGWVEFRANNIAERLEYFYQFKKLKGFRHIVQSEQQIDYLLREDFCNGISGLEKFGFTYDILIYPKHLKYALEFVKRFPNQTFILDHLAKPFIKDQLIDDWREHIKQFKVYENVSCKLAGLVTEAHWKRWNPKQFQKYVDVVFDVFGPDRVMFGSDWPVCTLAASFREVVEVVEHCTSFLNAENKRKLWGENSIRIYKLT